MEFYRLRKERQEPRFRSFFRLQGSRGTRLRRIYSAYLLLLLLILQSPGRGKGPVFQDIFLPPAPRPL